MSADDANTPGMLDVGKLRSAVEAGSIDTVILAFPDLYGRLVGQTARRFLLP